MQQTEQGVEFKESPEVTFTFHEGHAHPTRTHSSVKHGEGVSTSAITPQRLGAPYSGQFLCADDFGWIILGEMAKYARSQSRELPTCVHNRNFHTANLMSKRMQKD